MAAGSRQAARAIAQRHDVDAAFSDGTGRKRGLAPRGARPNANLASVTVQPRFHTVCTTHGRLVSMDGCELPRAAEAILSLMPLDTFVPSPVFRMKVVDDPERIMPVHERLQAVVDRAEGRTVRMEALERFGFYAAAKLAYAVVRTSDPGPYGCFILRKGVI